MRKTLFLTLVLLLHASFCLSQADSASRLRLIFAGDLMGHTPLHREALQSNGTYDYSPCFQYIKDYIQSADIAVVNLEVTLAGSPYTGYPCFSAPDALAVAARDAGFDIFATANNHCMDKGRRGLERTVSTLDNLNVSHLGTYRNLSERNLNHPFIVDRNGIRLAFLNYTYGTNGISVSRPNVVNLIDTALMRRDIAEARRQNADYIIAILHWGVEYQHNNNSEQLQLARHLFRLGCNAVIGGHPHVVQNLNPDFDTSAATPRPVVYSLGNFLSNQKHGGTDDGILVELELLKTDSLITVHNFAYLPFHVTPVVVDGRRRHVIIPLTDAVENPEDYHLSSADHRILLKSRLYHNKLLQAPATSRYPSVERRFFHNRKPSVARLFTYHYFNYDNAFPANPHAEPVYVYTFDGQLSVRRTAPVPVQPLSAYNFLDLDTQTPFGLDPGQAQPLPLQWQKLSETDTSAEYQSVGSSETLLVRIRKSGQTVTPAPLVNSLPGIVTHLWVNGILRLRLSKEEQLPIPHSAVPLQHR
ncbi:MAG: CapA family protein [Bacteroidales bacterium]|nr:CapA family protein [Bacteroidales bacterium]